MEKFRPEFRSQLAELKKLVFENLKPKTLNNRALTGAMFAGLIRSYVEAINSGGVPTISSAWDGITLAECRVSSKTHFIIHIYCYSFVTRKCVSKCVSECT